MLLHYTGDQAIHCLRTAPRCLCRSPRGDCHRCKRNFTAWSGQTVQQRGWTRAHAFVLETLRHGEMTD